MTLEAGLETYLLADTGVSALIGTRLYPVALPTTPTYPAATYRRESATRLRTLDGPVGRASPVIQIDCWAASYTQVKALAEAVRAALEGHPGNLGGVAVGTISLTKEVDDRDNTPAPQVFRVIQDYLIAHEES